MMGNYGMEVEFCFIKIFSTYIPDIYTVDTVVNGVAFTRLILPQIH